MRALVIGNSHVNKLRQIANTQFEHLETRVYINYYGVSGGSFHTFTENNCALLYWLKNRFNPQVIVCIVGGNSVNIINDNQTYYTVAEGFYQSVRYIFDGAYIIASQLEARYYKPGNRFNAPLEKEYKRRRVAINHFVSSLKFKDHVLMLSGKNRLDEKSMYEPDKQGNLVHFTPLGYVKLNTYIQKTVGYVMDFHTELFAN